MTSDAQQGTHSVDLCFELYGLKYKRQTEVVLSSVWWSRLLLFVLVDNTVTQTHFYKPCLDFSSQVWEGHSVTQ